MDPLSVTASLFGLAAAAIQITNALTRYCESIQQAPRLARSVIAETQALAAIFSQLKAFLRHGQGGEGKSRNDVIRRMSMTTVDQFVGILANCVLTFAELEKELDDLGGNPPNGGMWNHVKWSSKQPVLKEILADLQQQKLSLSLMIGVWNCRTNLEAMRKYELLLDALGSRENRLSRHTSTASLSHTYITHALDLQRVSSTSTFSTSQTKPFHKRISVPVLIPRRRSTASIISNHSISTMGSEKSQITVTTQERVSLDQVDDINKLSLPISARHLYNGKKYTGEHGGAWGPQALITRVTSVFWPKDHLDISPPFGFKHTTHIGVDPMTGNVRIEGDETAETTVVRREGWLN